MLKSDLLNLNIPQNNFEQEIISTYNVTALEYTPNFNLSELKPQPGDIFRIFIDQKYTNYSHPPISGRVLYGGPYYAPESDISAISSHFGCLFQYHKRKSTSHRRLNTIRNALELSLCGEAEYGRRAQVIQFPIETQLKGVLLTICIDYSPPYFSQCKKNGLRSRDIREPRSYSIRVSHFWHVSEFDEPIIFENADNYVRHKYTMPIISENDFIDSSKKESFASIEFNSAFFSQFLTRLNIINGLFIVYRVFFNMPDKKIEMTGDQTCNIIIRDAPSEDISLTDIAKRKDQPGNDIVTCELSEVEILPDGLNINKMHFLNITTITLIPIITIKASKKDKLS
ncbi:hypothetical protein M9Y10_028181 [Tritrichomonas musculus]|uniref:Uncharacterized protein n=1 Tax=Tritrichomonas musculus TaxID=1915356 RepID=A0ABR2KIL7_9EUKA